MLHNGKVLVLFTAEFPYGTVSETFLETEIHYLCEEFERVIIIPSRERDTKRILPENAYCEDILVREQPHLFLTDALKMLIFFLQKVFFERKPWRYFYFFRDVFYVLKRERKKFKALAFLTKTLPKNTIYYDYWYINSTLAIIWLKRSRLINHLVCRAHGYDLYDERSFAGVILFRKYIARNIDHVYFISNYGLSYFQKRVPANLHTKLSVSYLGVEPAKVFHQEKNSSHEIVVSISRIMPFKRVDKILRVLEHFNRPVVWYHFGGGEDLENLRKICAVQKNPLLKCVIVGQVNNSDVETFISANNISASILLSTSEGIPVSIMEVIRYGIPVLATNLPSLTEIVNSETGALVGIDETPDSIAKKLEILCDFNEERRLEIVKFYELNFNSQKNYYKFAKQLSELSGN